MQTLTERFLETVRRRSDCTAVVDPTLTLTYQQLAAHAAAVAGAVRAIGDRPFVGIAMPPCAAFPAAYFGILQAGSIPVPLNVLLEPHILAAIVADSCLETIITVPPLRSAMAKLVPNVVCPGDIAATPERTWCGTGADAERTGSGASVTGSTHADDMAMLLYTSGTSGPPKGVMLTHRNLLANVDSSVAMVDYSPDDVSLGVLPLFHTFGVTCTMLLPLLVGASVVYLPKFSPAAAVALISQHSVTCLFAVPSVYRLLTQAAQAVPASPGPSTLRFCVAGGEALGRPVADGFRSAFGVDLLEGYGMTEASPVISMTPPDAPRPGSVGVPLPWAEVKVIDPDGRPLPPDREGELLVRGQCVMKGYYQKEDQTRDTVDPDGWLKTGDIARLDADGYIYITGRAKEMIISAGENISPAEIESVLEQHPSVAEAAVVPMPDAARGEVPRAIIVLTPGATASESDLIEHCRERLSRIKRPRKIEFRDELPHTLTGKVLKRKL